MKQEPPDYGYDTPEYNEMDYQNYYNTYPSQMDYQENSGGHNIKQDSMDDSYPFYGSGEMYGVHQTGPPSNGGGIGGGGGGGGGGPGLSVTPKKRGRPRKIRPEDGSGVSPAHSQSAMGYPLADTNGIRVVKERKKHDRFNGMTEEEVSQRTLPDHLAPNLDIVIVGINPGLFAAYKGHHYAGPGNHFWKCLYLSGLIPEPMTADDDYKLLNLGIGFTNIVERATKGSADLTRKEIKIGGQVLLEKLQKYRPKIAVFNGKYIYEVFSGKKDFNFGRQPEMVEGTNTYMWVMPSSSARCAQLPRAADKVPFYSALKKFRDYLKGSVHEINESELVFSNFKMKNFIEPEMKEEIQEGQCSYNYNFSMSEGGYRHDGENPPPKKKRGRPKKVKVDDDGKGSKDDKPGTPLKYKEERDEFPQSENSNLSNHCFSPPTQSPGMPSYMYQQHQHQQQQPHPQQQQPPPSSHYTPSPQHYNPSPQNSPLQSPRPFSQHSDLSSDLRAAISSDNQAPQQSASSTTSSAFSPYFGGGSGAASNSGGGVVGGSGVHDDASSSSSSQRLQQQQQQQQQQQDEAAKPYSSPQNKPSYQSYDPSGYDDGYSKKSMAQDVSSRSLSGLESLIDQMRNDTDEDSTFHGDNRTSHFHPSLSGGGGGQYGGGNADSPNINGSSIGGAGSGNTGGGAGASLNSYVNFTAPPHIQMNDQHYSGGGGGGGGGYTNDHQSSNSPHSPRFAPLQQQQAQGGSGGCGDSGSSSSSSTLTPYNYPYTSSGYFPPTSSPYFTNSQLYSNISS